MWWSGMDFPLETNGQTRSLIPPPPLKGSGCGKAKERGGHLRVARDNILGKSFGVKS